MNWKNNNDGPWGSGGNNPWGGGSSNNRDIENSIKNDHIKNDVKERTQKMFDALKKSVEGIITLKQATPKSNDQILSYGERLAAPILAAKLEDMGLNSIALTGGDAGIITDDKFGGATPLIKLTKHRLQKNLDSKFIFYIKGS